MSIFQFFRIIWARRWIILASVAAAVVAATLVVMVIPPKYKAESRVILDIIRPDPVTGQILQSPFLRAYTSTQIQLIKDYDVASRVVKQLKLADDPALRDAYSGRRSTDDRDFDRWASQQIIDQTDAKVIEGSNIIAITYTSGKPEMAKKVADALREAFIATSLEDRRTSAGRNALWYDQQADKAKVALTAAETEKAEYERDNGILLQDDKTDVDTARLAALALSSASPVVTPMSSASTPAEMELAQVDADIAQASKVLGPNHPQLIELHRKHDLLEAQAEKERSASNSAAGMAASAARATAGLLEAQKAKVLSQREKVEHLKLLQDNVDLRREQYNKAAERALELRQEEEAAEAGLTPLGSAVTPQSPFFPNKMLIFAASLGMGGAGGAVLALGLEFLGRRVRSAEDLESLVDAPVLATVRRAPQKRRPILRRLSVSRPPDGASKRVAQA